MLRLTGTFIDEITHDIPSQNWGPKQWEREFALWNKIGVDTAVIIRCGYQDKCIFPSKVVPNQLPTGEDLAQTFFDLGEQYGVKIFVGTYDTGRYWYRRSWRKEVELNKAFIEEVVERYGDCSAFSGWYLCHETGRDDAHIIEIFNETGGHAKKCKDLPVLISPFPQGSKQFAVNDTMSLDESLEQWGHIFDATKGAFDICAFQDGQIQYHELDAFHAGISKLCNSHGIACWSNVESFDRDMPIKFPPADWRYLKLKMEKASRVASKLISFELPHFMSPNSSYISAHNLFDRYCEFHGIEI